MSIEKELRRGERFDLISFDIFDTLIVRDVVSPTDIFYMTGLDYFKDKEKASEFKMRRVKAEADARRRSANGEVNLKDIYRELFVIYGITAGILKERELRLEIEHCFPREKWKSLFEAYINKGKKVILISDMYLTSSEIKMMLDKCGIKGYEGLFVSNEYGCDKIGGKLYKATERAFGMENCRHMHYGDSIKADFLGARKADVIPRLVLKEKWMTKLIRKLL